MEIVLIRHTPTAAPEGTCYGHLDVPLADGFASAIAATLTKVPRTDAIFSSPLQRCAILAEALAKRDASQVLFAAELRELNFGAWEGQPWSQVPRTLSDPWAEDPWSRAPPGGETEQALWQRVETWRQQALAGRTGRVAVVAHGGSLRALRCLLLGMNRRQGWSWRIGYGAVEVLESSG
ncbi:MAG TPA: alpha-ribazole phosphatase family protein [Steroidobacteraceae bacterium]|jgi:alpha-ribazole phosphatase